MAELSTAGLGAPEEGFDFSKADFQRVRALIYQRAGISLNPSKRSMVYSRLSRRLRALGKRTSQVTSTIWRPAPKTLPNGSSSSMP